MRVGILGAGHMGQALARLLVQARYHVLLTNSRGPDSLAELVASLGPLASAGTPTTLVDRADIIVLATRWQQTPAAVEGLGPWNGKIVIDTTNNRFGPNPGDVYDLGELTSSEVVASLLPGAHVVKAFNHQPIQALLEDLGPRSPKGKVLFLAGDDQRARQRVAQLIRDIGGLPMDLGTLRDGGKLFATGGGPLAGHGRLLTLPEVQQILAVVGRGDVPESMGESYRVT